MEQLTLTGAAEWVVRGEHDAETLRKRAALLEALDKSRFGPLPWRIRIEVRSLGAEGAGAVVFPEGATVDEPAQWAALRSRP